MAHRAMALRGIGGWDHATPGSAQVDVAVEPGQLRARPGLAAGTGVSQGTASRCPGWIR